MERLIDRLAEKHIDWIHMARSFGCNEDEANELVQSMYVRLVKYIDDPERIMYNEKELNSFYVYVTLRNLFLSKVHKWKVDADLNNSNAGTNSLMNTYEYEDSFENLIGGIEEMVNSWYWYDKKLWEIHFKKQLSMRAISSVTRISLSSIFGTLKNGKTKVRNAFEKEWKEYLEAKQDKYRK
ncbi:MAG TPA: hypothetical protein DCX01_07875 [Bacteroidetes bacterium]|nr:hypothetical protein [Bacteroidota bacterium]